MNATEKKAEEIIRIAYNKGGMIIGDDLTKEQRKATKDDAVEYLLEIYGSISSDGIGYELNEKGFEFGRRGFFSGEEKEMQNYRTGARVAMITSIASVIIAIAALLIAVI